MNENELNDIFENDSCPNCEFYRSCFLFSIISLGFILLIDLVLLCSNIYSSFEDTNLNNNLEAVCNQLHDTNCCSVVFKNDDVVLFDTYNGYITMENILE